MMQVDFAKLIGPVCVFVYTGFVCVNTQHALLAQTDKPKPASLSVKVVDEDEKPVADASVEIRLWTGDWLKTEFQSKTDKNGTVEFEGLLTDRYSTILVKHVDYAWQMMDFTIVAGEQRTVTCKLLPPVESSIEVRSPDGKLVVGAEITRLTISSTESNSKTVITTDMFPMLTGRPKSEFRSDASGRAKLPPLPTGSSVTAEVLHPDWVSNTSTEAAVSPGVLTTVMLSAGTQVTAKFHGDESALAAIQSQEIAVRLFGQDIPNGRIIHKFANTDNSIQFTLPPEQYQSLNLSAKGVVITPQFPSSIYTFDFLKLATDRVEKNCVVRKTRSVRGRVVASDGKPVAGAEISVRTENLFANTDGDWVTVKQWEWASVGYAQTDQDGYYEVDLPAGKAEFTVMWSGYYSDPATMEVVIDQSGAVPDYVVKPYPTLKGIVVDEKQNSVPSAIVRLLSFGQPIYVQTDTDGKFSIQMSHFEYDQTSKSRTFNATLLAFNPDNSQAQITVVDANDPKAIENIKLELAPRDSDWIGQKLTERHWAMYMSEEAKASLAKAREKIGDRFADGLPGNRAPTLASGTWFNTKAKSLDDFRGQFVLLDFWFIGCGPCERDMPDIKLARDIFAKQGFTVLSVHIAGQSPENVKQFADARGMDYPLVVDSPSEEILNEYKKIGVVSFPSYLLIGPDGKIVRNDQVFDRARVDSPDVLSLRAHKLETILRALQKHNQ